MYCMYFWFLGVCDVIAYNELCALRLLRFVTVALVALLCLLAASFVVGFFTLFVAIFCYLG